MATTRTTHAHHPANYSSTAANSRPKLSGHRTSSNVNDPTPRTKILLLGMRRFVLTSSERPSPSPPSFHTFSAYRVILILLYGTSEQSTVIPLEIWDCPANTTVESLGVPLSHFSTIIFVIDIRDLYSQPISKLVEFIVAAYHDNPNIGLEVFVHKAEKLQEEDKIENFRQIHERVSDRLLDLSPEYEQMQLNFHLTSVYDHSLLEAFSRVLHKLIESLPYLEELLNVFCANSQASKAFLFETHSRLYIATDASPVDSATHNLCCDYLQMLNSFGPLYKSVSVARDQTPKTPPPSTTSPSSPSIPSSSSPEFPTPQHSTNGANGLVPPRNSSSSPNPVASPSSASSLGARLNATPITNGAASSSRAPLVTSKSMTSSTKKLFYPSASTTLSSPHVHHSGHGAQGGIAGMGNAGLVASASGTRIASMGASGAGGGVAPNAPMAAPSSTSSTTLTYHLITKHLALLALIPTSVYEERRGLVEFNVVFLREGIQEICDAEEEARGVS
ncbi:hypothetical protein CVT24_009060 [Panaeolus cyanescens]|uniref:GTP-binding protein n=1 Tax=Panaeolus cyanescens TaxID=181874 RepID=A0A409VEP0_9AGAR|nr:hypothetical protein CVT24_009060 [Panaeolus cyanescens]